MSATLKVNVFEEFFDDETSNRYYKELIQLPFQELIFSFRGKLVSPKRKVYGFSDPNIGDYAFSGTSVPNNPWTPEMLLMKRQVEKAVNCSFNSALVNYYSDGTAKIAPHHDAERSLDSTAPIACVSLGATRTMMFTKPGEEAVNIALKNGSLIVMHPATNTEWKHSIPSEPEVKEGRISVTFRKIHEGTLEPPSKRFKSIDEEFEDPSTDRFFTNLLIDSTVIASNSVSSMNSPCENSATPPVPESETICQIILGNNVHLSLVNFHNTIKVHIRLHAEREGVLRPTRIGVVFDLDYISIESYNTNNKIKLDIDQIDKLKEQLPTFNENVLIYLYNKRLPSLIRNISTVLPILSPEEERNIELGLVQCVEEEMVKIFPRIFKCFGCIIDHPSQKQHHCVRRSCLEKYHELGENTFMLLDLESIAEKFVNIDISDDFLKNINIRILKDVIFK